MVCSFTKLLHFKPPTPSKNNLYIIFNCPSNISSALMQRNKNYEKSLPYKCEWNCEWFCHVRCWKQCNAAGNFQFHVYWRSLVQTASSLFTYELRCSYLSEHVICKAMSVCLIERNVGKMHIRLIINHNICASIKRCLFHAMKSLILPSLWGNWCKWIHFMWSDGGAGVRFICKLSTQLSRKITQFQGICLQFEKSLMIPTKLSGNLGY